MEDRSSILLELCKEQWTQARHTELQRTAISTLLIAVESAIIGFISQQGLSLSMLVMYLVLAGLGAFGAFVTFKLYELFHYHHDKAKKWQSKIDTLNSSLQIDELERQAEAEHRLRYPFRAQKIRLNWLWMAIHFSMLGIGILFSLISIVSALAG